MELARVRRLGFATLLACTFWYIDQPTDGWYSPPANTQPPTGECSPGQGRFYSWSEHAHSCSGFSQFALSECDGSQLIDAQNCVVTNGLSYGSLSCSPGCCENNGCQAGNEGSQWSRSWCGPYGTMPDGCGCCMDQGGCPVMISLRGLPIRLSSAQSGVVFDFASDGAPMRWAWPLTPDDSFLAMDRNGNGQIDNASELFGNFSVLRSGERAENGYEALRELDTNSDSIVDVNDVGFAQLRVWRELKRNGVVDSGELIPLQQAGITKISTNYNESEYIDQWGNAYKYRSPVTFSHSPTVRFSADVFLTYANPTSP